MRSPDRRSKNPNSALVEFFEVYPTLVDIGGRNVPLGVEGISLKPLLGKPDQPWKRAVFSQCPRVRRECRQPFFLMLSHYAVHTPFPATDQILIERR